MPGSPRPSSDQGSHPWLSVIMPTWNGASYLERALGSIAEQEDDEVEVVAVDDGSTDRTVEILAHYSDRINLRTVRRERTGNWVSNTNLGLSLATGSYACILHQDDYWLPGRLRTLRRWMERHPEAVMLFHPSWYVDHAERRLGQWTCPLPHSEHPLPRRLVIERLLVQNFVSVPAVLFRRETWQDSGGMDAGLWYTADWDLWLKLAARGEVLYCPEPLACFRLHGASQTIRASVSNDGFRSQLRTVLDRHVASWESCHDRLPTAVRRAADFSVEVNTALAASFHGDRYRFLALLPRAVMLGPGASLRYLRDSRLLQRVTSRLRTALHA